MLMHSTAKALITGFAIAACMETGSTLLVRGARAINTLVRVTPARHVPAGKRLDFCQTHGDRDFQRAQDFCYGQCAWEKKVPVQVDVCSEACEILRRGP